MSILLKHIIRNMSENKFRSFAIIFIVALSTLVSVISLSLQDVINDTYEKVYNASVGEANITITSNDYMDLEQINLDGITVDLARTVDFTRNSGISICFNCQKLK